ncbi:MAG: hypothetical protein ACFFA1_01785 [Promethearchaeota archaeon]
MRNNTTKPSDKYSKMEISELGNFLAIFGEKLLRKMSPEKAFREAIKQYDGPLKQILSEFVAKMYEKGLSLVEACRMLEKTLLNPQSRRLLRIVVKSIQKDAYVSGERIISIVTHLRENQQLVAQRESIVRAQEFKLRFLVIVSSCIFGIITTLAPWFSMLNILHGEIATYNLTQMLSFDQFYILITFGAISVLTTYANMSMLRMNKIGLYVVLSLTLYLIVYLVAHEFLMFLL